MKDKNIIGALILILVIMLTMMYFHGKNNYYNGYEKGYDFGFYMGDLEGCIGYCELINSSDCLGVCDDYLYNKSNHYYNSMDLNLSNWESPHTSKIINSSSTSNKKETTN